LREAIPNIGIIFLTTYDDPRLLRSNLPPIPEGSEYLVKRNVSNIQFVTNAIDAAIASGEMISKGEKAISSAVPPEFKQFTDIQIETLRLVSEGLTNAEIAEERFISEKSVEQTISRIAKILNLSSDAPKNQRVHLARIFFRLTGSTPSE
jgi:DNA-binding NarL/FixJ family response regulator